MSSSASLVNLPAQKQVSERPHAAPLPNQTWIRRGPGGGRGGYESSTAPRDRDRHTQPAAGLRMFVVARGTSRRPQHRPRATSTSALRLMSRLIGYVDAAIPALATGLGGDWRRARGGHLLRATRCARRGAIGEDLQTFPWSCRNRRKTDPGRGIPKGSSPSNTAEDKEGKEPRRSAARAGRACLRRSLAE